MHKWEKAVAIAFITGAGIISAGCAECPAPYYDCDEPGDQTETPTPAPTLGPVSKAICPLETREGGGDYYWATVMGWTGPTTLMVTNVNKSRDTSPDVNHDAREVMDLGLKGIEPIDNREAVALSTVAATNPAGSWLRFRSAEKLDVTVINEVSTANHHGWSNEILLVEAGAAEPTEDADPCVRAAAGPEDPEEGADTATATGTVEQQSQREPAQYNVAVAPDPNDPEMMIVTVTSADGDVLATTHTAARAGEQKAAPATANTGPQTAEQGEAATPVPTPPAPEHEPTKPPEPPLSS